MIDITCPHCKGMLQAESVSPGMVMECPLCGKKFTLPYERTSECSSGAGAGGFFSRFKKGNKRGCTRYFFGRTVCGLIRFAACLVLIGGVGHIVYDFMNYRSAQQKIQSERNVPNSEKINRMIDTVNKTWIGTVETLSYKQSRGFKGNGLNIPESIRCAYLESSEDLNEVSAVVQARESVEAFKENYVKALQRLLTDYLNQRLTELEKYADDSNQDFVVHGRTGGKISYSHVNNVIFYQKTEEGGQHNTIRSSLRAIEYLKFLVVHEKISISGFDRDCNQMIKLLKFLESSCFSSNFQREVGESTREKGTVRAERDQIKARIRGGISVLRANIGRLMSGWQVSAELDQLDFLLFERKNNLEKRDLELKTLNTEYIRSQTIFVPVWLIVVLLILGVADALRVWFDFGDFISGKENG